VSSRLLNLVLMGLIIVSPLSKLMEPSGKYHGTLLIAISQDGNQNIFPLAFTIVE